MVAPHRCEVEAQEAAIERLEAQLAGSERRAAAAEKAAAEKAELLSYVGEEVDRVKALYEQKVWPPGCCRPVLWDERRD